MDRCTLYVTFENIVHISNNWCHYGGSVDHVSKYLILLIVRFIFYACTVEPWFTVTSLVSHLSETGTIAQFNNTKNRKLVSIIVTSN